jgi:hypothetical protein
VTFIFLFGSVSLGFRGSFLLGGFQNLFNAPRIEFGIIQVYSRKDRTKNRLRLLQALLKSFDIPRRWISPSV